MLGRQKIVLQAGWDAGEPETVDNIVRLPKSTLLTPGTFNGITFRAEEIMAAKVPKVFPLTLNHSRNVEDEVGWFEDVERIDGKLRAVPVINLETAKGAAALGYVKNRTKAGLIPNLSVELWATIERGENGEQIAHDIEIVKASLVDIGACSPESGCGVGLQAANAEITNEGEMISMGIVPKHPWKYPKDAESAWEKPTLSDFTDKAWDELTDDEKRNIAGHYAWTPENPPARFTDLKLPHHRPDDHAVVWNGVRAAMAALAGARGGVNIPNDDVPKVYRHLAEHYKEFDKVPPELKQDENGKWFVVWVDEEEPATDVNDTTDAEAKTEDVVEAQEMNADEPTVGKATVEVVASEQKEGERVTVEPCPCTELEAKVAELTEKLKAAEAELEKVRAELAAYKEKERGDVIKELKQYAPDMDFSDKSTEELKELLEFAKRVAGGKAGRKTLIETPDSVNAERMFEMVLEKALERIKNGG